MTEQTHAIDALQWEQRRFPPSDEFKRQALVTGTFLYDDGDEDYQGFWATPGRASCSTGRRSGTPSASGSCRTPSGSSAASSTSPRTASTATSLPAGATRWPIHWEGEPGDSRTITYAELLDEVQRFANVAEGPRRRQGRPGQHLPADDPRGRRGDAGLRPHRRRRTASCSAASPRRRSPTASTTPRPRCSITADGGYRRGEVFPLKPAADEAVAADAEHRARRRRAARRQRRRRWSTAATTGTTTSIAAADAECPAEPMDAEQLLFLLYTSGTTGKPKGIMHTTGGYLTQVAFTHKYVFDLHPDTDVYWCTADVGWVTGHSYIVYGPLANGATQRDVRGRARTIPGNDRLWEIVEKYERHDLLHGAHGHPHVHEVGRRRSRPSTTCRRCGCSARSASRSTPRRGCGTASTSAAGAARSSTRGGRPRPAGS